MKNIDKKLIEWSKSRIKSEYPEDIALLIGQYGACKLPCDEQTLAIDYFVPATERGYNFSKTFIIEDMGYDLYPMDYKRLESIADLNEPRMINVLEKSEIIYAKSEEEVNRFEKIKARLHENLANRKLTEKKHWNFWKFQWKYTQICSLKKIYAKLGKPQEELQVCLPMQLQCLMVLH